jgi:hypothetical protein
MEYQNTLASDAQKNQKQVTQVLTTLQKRFKAA